MKTRFLLAATIISLIFLANCKETKRIITEIRIKPNQREAGLKREKLWIEQLYVENKLNKFGNYYYIDKQTEYSSHNEGHKYITERMFYDQNRKRVGKTSLPAALSDFYRIGFTSYESD